MDYKKLIEKDENIANRWESGEQIIITGEFRPGEILRENARAIIELLNRLKHIEQEKNAAITDLNNILSIDDLCPLLCEWCLHNNDCDGFETPKWRGIKEE